jgi:hypothetical protein
MRLGSGLVLVCFYSSNIQVFSFTSTQIAVFVVALACSKCIRVICRDKEAIDSLSEIKHLLQPLGKSLHVDDGSTVCDSEVLLSLDPESAGIAHAHIAHSILYISDCQCKTC